jgi:Glycosyl hydrolase family 26
MPNRWKLTLLTLATLVLAGGIPTAASAATVYLRPDGTVFTSKPWAVIGSTSAWDALNDEVTESQTPSAADYIKSTGFQETRVSLGTANIRGVEITKATIWYYTSTSQPVEVKSSADSTWQTSNSIGWHSRSETISGQAALNELYLQLKSGSTTSVPREVLAAFLRIDTSGPKVYWGAWMDGDVYAKGSGDAPWNETTWNEFEKHAGKKVSIVHFGQPAPWMQAFAAEPLERSRTRGALPLMDMGTGCRIGKSCHSEETVEEEEVNRVSLAEINEGKYDSYFESWAQAVAKYGYPFFFRWAWEMNGSWFKWGRDAIRSPSEYVKAWRRIHNITINAHATNITWVWCPNVEASTAPLLTELYPGDAYVDWTCLDGYNRGQTHFIGLFQNSYSALTGNVAPSKPVMIGETATVGGSGHFSQSEWIREGLSSLSSTFPKIKAFVWFNWNIVEEGREWEWPIESTAGGEKAFAEEISSSYFAANEFGAPALLEPIKPLP